MGQETFSEEDFVQGMLFSRAAVREFKKLGLEAFTLGDTISVGNATVHNKIEIQFVITKQRDAIRQLIDSENGGEAKAEAVGKEWFSVRELADKLGFTKTWISELIKRGDIQGVKVFKRQWRIPRIEYERLTMGGCYRKVEYKKIKKEG